MRYLLTAVVALLIYAAPAQATVHHLGGSPWSASSVWVTHWPGCSQWLAVAPGQTVVIAHPNQAVAGRFDVREAVGWGWHGTWVQWHAQDWGRLIGNLGGSVYGFGRFYGINNGRKVVDFTNFGNFTMVVAPVC
jgi:hypothetical protein